MTKTKTAEIAERIVANEVHACMSGVVNRMRKLEEVTGRFDIVEMADGRLFGYWDESEEAEEYNEVYEHWAVSKWLAEKLAEKGEVIELDFYGVCLWGRGTTGQAIAIDYVIEEIAKDIA